MKTLLVATVAGARTPAFEVVSVKPNPSVTENSGENSARGRFTATNDTLKQLLQLALGWTLQDTISSQRQESPATSARRN